MSDDDTIIPGAAKLDFFLCGMALLFTIFVTDIPKGLVITGGFCAGSLFVYALHDCRDFHRERYMELTRTTLPATRGEG